MTDETDQVISMDTILVVDDHRPAALMLKRLFETNGYQVECVYNGEDALEWVRHQLPNLIILDVMMPGLNGYQVLQALRDSPRTQDVPTILATAKDTPEDIEQGLKLGANDYVPKPIKPRELLARAHSQIEASRLRKALERRTTDLEALLRISEELNTRLDVDELLNLFVFLILDLLPVNKAQVGLFTHENQLQKGVQISDRTELNPSFDVNRKSTTRLLQSGSTIQTVIDDAVHILLLLPYEEGGYGILEVTSDIALDDAYLRLLEAIAKQGTLALRNAILYETKLAFANHLQDMVDERTYELRQAQTQLIQSEKLASVGRLAAGIAHEINNPLTPIQLILEGMKEDIEFGDIIKTEDIQRILDSVIRIKGIVERLQQFTRHRQSAEPVMENIALSEIIGNVLALTSKVLQQQHIEVNVKLDDNIVVQGNRDQLSQVILNLVLNANAAMNNNGQLTIKLYQKGVIAHLLIQDNGIGIAEENQSKIFEPFMTTKDDGSGLGLFISYEIINNHNGNIYVDSAIGEGATFTVTLPIAQ